MFVRRRSLRNKSDQNSIERLKEGGGVNASKLWNLKKKLQGIVHEPPTAMMDNSGNLVTTKSSIGPIDH